MIFWSIVAGPSGGIYQFLLDHPFVSLLLVSGGLFVCGIQELTKGDVRGAYIWQSLAVTLLLIYLVDAIAVGARVWIAVGVIALSVEILLIARQLQRRRAP